MPCEKQTTVGTSSCLSLACHSLKSFSSPCQFVLLLAGAMTVLDKTYSVEFSPYLNQYILNDKWIFFQILKLDFEASKISPRNLGNNQILRFLHQDMKHPDMAA